MGQAIEKLIFIYNANSGLSSAIVDSAKKLFKLKACSLCTITHGLVTEKKDWISCKTEIDLPIDYFHKDDMPATIKNIVNGKLPCIVAESKGKHIILLSAQEIDACLGDAVVLGDKLKKSMENIL